MNCNTIIDYSKFIGEKILPFTVAIDLNKSILNPAIGENQRFCYIVTGIGSDISQYTDLSHFVLGICDQISESEIVNITVTINDVEQTVVFGEGGNVELKTPSKPDSTTGCPGLKFNFGLNKVNGVMNICFELTTVYPIGGSPVCLFGGSKTVKGLTICGPSCKQPEPQSCIATGYQKASICVPITVTPFANVEPTLTFCCGSPIITPGKGICTGMVNGSCGFTLSQKICVSVPIEFGAVASTGEPVIQCGNTSNKDICTNCSSQAK